MNADQKQQPKPIITTNDSMMVKEGLRQPLVIKRTRIRRTDSESAWLKHFKSLEKRGKVIKVGPLYLNKV